MHRKWLTRFSVILCFLLPGFLSADREAVLKQIDLPHPYYYREMYLPQLTSGPSSVAWSPDSQWLVYSMQGSLWRQRLDSTTAEQLTAGPGYDYQPDWSPDGKWIVFTRYDKDALELYILEVSTGKLQQITSGGAVNVEPRWSPDGEKLAFVSTSYNKHFHIFVAFIQEGAVQKVQQLTEERRSSVPRYYYSPFDHEISPTWSPDSSEIIFVCNHETVNGSGGFWRMKTEPGSPAKQIRYEETTWKPRPDWSPDGKRVIYSSYLGRQWHQLWIMTSEGGDPFPLSYGEFDITAARWSRDGKKIAFISNQDGNTSLWIQEAIGGHRKKIANTDRRYLRPMAHLKLTVLSPKGEPTPTRVFITHQDGRAYAPDNAWIHADDGFDRSERAFEPHYFHSTGRSEIAMPSGKATIEVMKGFDHEFSKIDLELKENETFEMTVRLKPLIMPKNWSNWISGDLHVHMNYTGAYRNTPKNLMFQAASENLNVIHNLIVNKEQRIPDISYFTGKLDPVSTSQTLLFHDQEFHTSYWGHMGLLNLTQNYLIPDYASYYNTGAASPYPTNSVVADLTHAQGGLVGYVHPYDSPPPDPLKDERLTHALPVDVALGKADYIEVVGFSDHRATAAVWYRLLNCGFRLTAGAGTDAMANFASLRGPVGTNRVYVHLDGALNPESWVKGLREGRTLATNGPLLSFTLNGQEIGSEIKLPSGAQELKFSAAFRSIVPVDHLQIVFNGEVVKELELDKNHQSGDFAGSIPVNQSGWFVLRAWSEKATYPILDIYPYGSTSPIYVTIDGKPVRSSADAGYFIAWIDRIIESAKAHTGYNTEAEKTKTLKTLTDARAIFQQCQ